MGSCRSICLYVASSCRCAHNFFHCHLFITLYHSCLCMHQCNLTRICEQHKNARLKSFFTSHLPLFMFALSLSPAFHGISPLKNFKILCGHSFVYLLAKYLVDKQTEFNETPGKYWQSFLQFVQALHSWI